VKIKINRRGKMRKADWLWGLFWAVAFGIIVLSCAVVESFAADKWDEVIISSNSISAATALDDCDPIPAYNIRYLAVTTRFTFNVAVGSDVTVGWYTSTNGIDYDTIPVSTYDIEFAAGETIQDTHNFTPDAMYHKFLIDNSDSTTAITGATMTYIGSN